MTPTVELDSYLPDGDYLSETDVAIAMLQAMAPLGLSEARAECPFCGDGWLYAGRIGNARRLSVECDSCGRGITESFRSAIGPIIMIEN